MIGAAGILLALGLGGAAMPVAEFDIPYFLAHPQIREETLRRCHSDQRLANTPECQNAERAGTRSLGKPLPPLKSEGKRSTPPEIPVTKGRERAA